MEDGKLSISHWLPIHCSPFYLTSLLGLVVINRGAKHALPDRKSEIANNRAVRLSTSNKTTSVLDCKCPKPFKSYTISLKSWRLWQDKSGRFSILVEGTVDLGVFKNTYLFHSNFIYELGKSEKLQKPQKKWKDLAATVRYKSSRFCLPQLVKFWN